ncbi:MAG: signal peptide peptidase SppA [Deltaproteobacteria bacterium]|nr:signal peptide peptidase SppA [Deltaproteobacteria bacterium]
MKKVLVGILAAIGALVVVLTLLGLAAAACGGKGSVARRTVLELNLERGLVEARPENPLAFMGRRQPTLRDVVEALERAADDDRVKGVVARIGAARLGTAQVQEIRDAVIRFRGKKKPAVAFAETFGEFGPGSGSYYLATAFDQIYLQPVGEVGLTGLQAETPFVTGSLEKVGVRVRGDRRHEYKNAWNMLTEKKFTPAHKEATERLIQSIAAQMVRGIAQARKLSDDEVRALMDRGPLLAQEALEARLVDGLKYRDEVYEQVKTQAGKNAKLLYVAKYLERAGRPHKKGKTIALIYGVGDIHRGKSSYDAMSGEQTMGAETVAQAFRAAVDDKDVKAILFRIDSPGGSAVASDVVWREVGRARKAGKPVIASMGSVAGSGGYYIAMAADKIVAQPGTITGSIGVFTFKPLTAGLWEKLGVSWDEVHTNKNSMMWTGLQDYTPEGWQRVQAVLDFIYADFTGKVAEGRKLPKEKVLEIAKGRIWTGEDAKARGLVDELGGYTTALALCKQAAGIPADAKVKLKVFPRPQAPLAALLGDDPENSDKGETSEVGVAALAEARDLAALLRRLGLVGGARGPLAMPAVPALGD